MLEHEALSGQIIGAAVEVHRELGPGLLESAYEVCLCDEMGRGGLAFRRQVDLPVEFRGWRLDCGYRMDVVVENAIVLEIKATEKVLSIHEAQILTSLRLSRLPAGMPLNFNVPVMREGIKRFALTRFVIPDKNPPPRPSRLRGDSR